MFNFLKTTVTVCYHKLKDGPATIRFNTIRLGLIQGLIQGHTTDVSLTVKL